MSGLLGGIVVGRLAVVERPQVVFVLLTRLLLLILRERAALPNLASTQVIPGSFGRDIHCIVVSECRICVLVHQVLSLPFS